MLSLLKIRKGEWPVMAVTMLFLALLHYLMISKFTSILLPYEENAWDVFMRNYHMSGFDPILYKSVAEGCMRFDLLRHPLLPLVLYPLYGLNMLLQLMTGVNCAQFIIGGLLLFCGCYISLFIHRTIHDIIGVPRGIAFLLTLLFLSFAYVTVTLIVADHFALSLFILTMLVYLAGQRIREQREFSMKETALALLLTGGITLSNAAMAVLIILFVNGRDFFRRRFLTLGIILPSVALLAFAVTLSNLNYNAQVTIDNQMEFIGTSVSRIDLLIENFFGESLQLHREHVLGDVLTSRPIIVRYNHPYQYVVESILVLYFLVGAWIGRKQRFLWLLASLLGFNLLLHVVIGFAIEEVYIMAAHWVYILPLVMAYTFSLPAMRRWKGWIAAIPLLAVTLWLWAWHTYILYSYLTWPLRI